jgi:aryl-alcohol dehydrogenase-like predicted oxidoreductase
MEYRNLGRTGVKVSPLCLGAMMFGQRGNPDHNDCLRIIHYALDQGINFVDTANVYSNGESEEIVEKALKGRRHKGVLPVCEKYGTGVIPWSPLNRGWLAGKYRKNKVIDPQSRVSRGDRFIDTPDSPTGQKKLELVEQLVPMAEETGATLAQYALAWTLTNSTITAPIIGPRTMEQLEGNLGALSVHIPEEHLKKIDQLVPPGTDV